MAIPKLTFSDKYDGVYLYGRECNSIKNAINALIVQAQTLNTGMDISRLGFPDKGTNDFFYPGECNDVRDTINKLIGAYEELTQAAEAPGTVTYTATATYVARCGTDKEGTGSSVSRTATAVSTITQADADAKAAANAKAAAVGALVCTVTVAPPPPPPSNIIPVANAGADNTITLPTSSFVLPGYGTDSDGTIVAYSWSQSQGPVNVTFSSKTIAQPTVTGATTAGEYRFQLIVTDNAGGVSLADEVIVTVQPAQVATLVPSLTLPSTAGTVGTALAYTAGASGGTAPYQLLVQAEDEGGNLTQLYSGSGASYSGSWKPTVVGKFFLTNTVTDATGTQKISTVRTVTVTAATPGFSVTLTSSAQQVVAGNSVTFTAEVVGAAQFVQFKNAQGTLLGTRNAAPFQLSYTPQAAGELTVIATATANNGTTAISQAVTVTVTQAQVVTPARGNTVGRWDATVNSVDGGGNWAEASGNGKILVPQNGVMTYNATGLKGLPALVSGGAGFLLDGANLGSAQDLAFIAVVQPTTPMGPGLGLISTKNWQYAEIGAFNTYIDDETKTGAGDVEASFKMLFGDQTSFGSLDFGVINVAEPMVLGVQVSPSRQMVSLRYNGQEKTASYGAFQANLLDRGLSMGAITGALQVLHLFSGATQQTYEEWIAYYTSRLSNSVEPNTLFAKDATVSRALFVPENNPSGIYSTGTEWVVDTNAATLDVTVVPGTAGVGVFVNDVWLEELKTTVAKTIQLGAAGTTRRVRLVAGRAEGSNTSEDGIQTAFVIKVKYPASSTTGWAVQAKKTKATVILGDSISVGSGPDISSLNGPFQRLSRLKSDMDFLYDGWGNRSWKGSLFTEGARNVSVARWVNALSGYAVKVGYMQLGTNDFTGQGTSDEVAQAFVDYIRVLRAAIPGIILFVQTPTGRNGETTNYGGGVMADYRTKITNAVQGIANLTVIPGPSLLTANDTSDGVHPATGGAATYAQALQPYFQNL